MQKPIIAGVGFTKISAHWKSSLKDLASEAALKALNDAGNPEIKAIVVGNMMSGIINGQENLGSLVAESIGLQGVPSVKVEAACASGAAAVMWACLSVLSGIFESVLVVGVEKMTDVTDNEDMSSALATAADYDYEVFFGATFPSLNAMIMRSYAEKYNLSPEDFGHLPILMHKNAVDVAHAQLRFPITMEGYLNSPVISDPLKLYDSAPIGDGAAALVITSRDGAGNLDHAVEIAGFGSATDTLATYRREDITSLMAAKLATKRALSMAALEPKDFDIVQIHDAFSVIGYLNLEALGIVEKGKAHKFIASGDADRSGALPVNPEGGLKARGHPVGATGVYQIAELALQLSDRAGPSQIENPNVGVAMNIGGTGANVIVHVLRRIE
ncbi:MAG TPA: thiolase domain-containing protein [Candidatus Korarchaeota archaeon]|nr:MAG: thiolase domain-containing protein [Candidatus Korarchaeota archaeon]HDD68758.1 thiolase domain-containing protein [Candidatus Korarchaeota archaeon]